MRFLNEAEEIKERGGLLIKVNNKHANNIISLENKHISEIEMDNYQDFDIVINNNSSIDDLLKEIEKIIKKYRL